jgi:cation transporter-like permease
MKYFALGIPEPANLSTRLASTFNALAIMNIIVCLNDASAAYFYNILSSRWAKHENGLALWAVCSNSCVGVFLIVSAVYLFIALYRIIKLANDRDGSTQINTVQLSIHFFSFALYLIAYFAE